MDCWYSEFKTMMHSYIPSIEEFQGDLIIKPVSGEIMQTTPDVTVVTVCFNPLKAGRQDLFAENLDSVQQQTNIILEHLIIDGGSTDGTLDFLKAYKNQNHIIRIQSKADLGIYDAMNRGIALAQGKYVTFLNSDDHYHCPDGLVVSMKALEESGCSFSFAPILAKKVNNRIRHRRPHHRLHKAFVFNVVCHQSMLFRKEDIINAGGYDLAYEIASDYDLMLRLIALGRKAYFVNHCFVTFVEGGFAMQNRKRNKKEKSEIIRNFHRDVFGVKLSEEEAWQIVNKCKYPRKYLHLYEQSQKLVSDSFVNLPQRLSDRLIRRFNYVKYWLWCFLSPS